MFTILGGDGQEYGPATVEQIRSWIAAGRANLETQAKVAGSEEWHRLGDYPEFSGAARSTARPFTAANAPAREPSALVDPRIPRPPLNIFSCLDRSFGLWKSNFLSLVGATLLVVFIQMLMNVIPIVGSFAGLLLNGVFYGGLYYFYLGKIRGERREIGAVFAGFSRGFVPLMLATVLTNLLLLVVAVVFFFPLVKAFAGSMSEGSTRLPELPPFNATSAALMCFGGLVLVYLIIGWAFTFALIVDKRMDAWAAMEASRRIITKQWFRIFVLCFFAAILAMLGVIALFVGVLFTLPLAFAPLLYAYEDLCNSTPAVTPLNEGDVTRLD